MTQLTLFDSVTSERAKERGMAAATQGKSWILALARELAKKAALTHPDRECSADDVQFALAAAGHDIHRLGNAAGSIFRGPNWVFTGKWVKSVRVHAHAPIR